jgi:cobaltochelatase CobN
MLYGALDNDDFFMYMGGLATAVRNIDGVTPELVVTNTRDPGNPQMTSMDKFIGMEFRSRYVNPTWIAGMKQEGYAGAVEMRAFVEYLWGWDATVSDVVDDAMWEESFEVYVEDKHDLGMKEWFEENSPFAYQDMSARMIETVRKGYWDASEATETRLLEEFIESVNQHGASCSELTCGNPRLLAYVIEEALAKGIPVPAIESFREVMEVATGVDITSAAARVEDFVRRNEPLPVEAPPPAVDRPTPESPETEAIPRLEGFVMNESRTPAPPTSEVLTTGGGGGRWGGLWVGLPILGFLLVWRLGRKKLA